MSLSVSPGIAKLVIGFDLMKVLLPLYGLGIVLTVLSTEEFVNVGWDSAGVTTGPVTVPLCWRWASALEMQSPLLRDSVSYRLRVSARLLRCSRWESLSVSGHQCYSLRLMSLKN